MELPTELEEMETFWIFRLWFCQAYDSAYDSDFDFQEIVRSLMTPTTILTDSMTGENQPVWTMGYLELKGMMMCNLNLLGDNEPSIFGCC